MRGSSLRAPRPVSLTFAGGQPVRTYKVGRGETASMLTLKIMRDQINEAAKDYEVRVFAEHILDKYPETRNCNGACDVEKMHAVWDYLVSKTRYMHDPHGFEFWKTPPLVLAEISQGGRPQLDCDDYTVTSLALLRSVGVPVMIRAAAYGPKRGLFGLPPLTHVYGLAWSRREGAWIPVDCVNRNEGPGWEKTPYTRVKNFVV